MEHDRTRSSRSISAKQIGIGVIVVVLIIFALINRNDVRVDFLVTDVTLPLVVIIAGCALLGFVVGYFVRRNRD